MIDKSIKIFIAIVGFVLASVATVWGGTLVASLANVSPILGIILATVIVAFDSAVLALINSNLK